MLLSKTAIVKWNNKNKNYYINKGYNYTKCGEDFVVNIEDLTLGSKSIIEVQCDYCGKIISKQYLTYNKQHHPQFGDCCQKCQPIKNKLCCIEKYGVDNGSKTKTAIDKIKQTSLERYGVSNPSQTEQAKRKIREANIKNLDSIKQKISKTNIEKYGSPCVFSNKNVYKKCQDTLLQRYGVKHPKQSNIIKEKEKQQNMAKYGVNYYSQTQEAKDKMIATNLKKYGYKYTLQVPSIRQKGMETLLKNGTCPTSKQQLIVAKMLKELYGDCKVNLPCGNNFLDCVVEINNYHIDIEYDGRFWHQDEQRDRRRDEFVKSQGYKVLRIKANHSTPTKEQLIKAIDYLVKDNHSYTAIELDI